MSFLLIFLAILATARLTRLVTTDGITEPLRDRLEAKASFGDQWVVDLTPDGATARLSHRTGKWPTFVRFVRDITECDWCTSVWIGAGVAAAAYFLPFAVFAWPALALGASYAVGLMAMIEGKLEVHND